jgi:putative transposase
VSAVAAALGVSRPHLSSRQKTAPRRRGRPPLPDAELLAAIQALVADLPTYGYRRVHALLRRDAERKGRPVPNVKRVYRVMKVHGLLLQRHAGGSNERRHEGRVAVNTRNTRWCSDGLEIGCDNGERVRVAFALDCCDREAMSFVATTAGITGEDVRDLIVAAVEHRFGRVNYLPSTIEWLTDIACPGLDPGAAATSPARPAALPETSVWCRERRRWKARKATAWPRRSRARSSATTSGSLPSRTPKLSCACSHRG